MLDHSITLPNIELFIHGLADELRKHDCTLNVVQFGSSLNGLPEDNLDIDLLLLSQHNYFDNHISAIILELKEKLLIGMDVKGFRTEHPKIQKAYNNFVRGQTIFRNSNIFPKYVFGPFSHSIQSTNSNVFLHFKGPLKVDEFSLFCKELPFHGYSILAHHKVIRGLFDEDFFQKEIILNKTSLTQFNVGLKNRIDTTNSISEAKKCVKKIVLNNSIFYDQKLKIPGLDLSSINDISTLRKMFEDLYEYLPKKHIAALKPSVSASQANASSRL